MRSLVKIFHILSGMLMISGFSWAGSFSSSANGTSAAGFLELGVSARAQALGDAYSALADEASALYWNPAALSLIKKRSIILTHATYVDSGFFDYAAYAQSFGRAGSFAVGFEHASAGEITRRDDEGFETGSYTPRDLALSFGYSHDLKNWSLGISAKYIQSQITRSAQAAVFDFGALSPAILGEKLRLAATVTNLGSPLKFNDVSENLPLAFRLGSAYKFSERCSTSLDAQFPLRQRPSIAMGAEYRVPILQFLSATARAGFNSRSLQEIGGFSGVTFGAGLGLKQMSLDYASVPFGSLGLLHRVSLSYQF